MGEIVFALHNGLSLFEKGGQKEGFLKTDKHSPFSKNILRYHFLTNWAKKGCFDSPLSALLSRVIMTHFELFISN